MLNVHFDPKKRQTIKLLTGAALVAGVPAVSMPAGAFDAEADVQEVNINAVNAELSFSLHVDEQAVLKMANNTDRLLIVRHVHPGIVHAGRHTFDINAAFERSAYAISAGHTRSVELKPIDPLVGEVEFSRSQYRNMPQRIVSLTGSDKHGMLVNSTRSFYA